ncbi:hypothetical protein WJX81_000347 [Elliptochloris bilobata]|uniref:Uncharacterized protein n=1 Tax=Elliptochloris bilobata TaxID=381761 RepID=A0AAW1RRZ6_9CHLO
MHVAERKDLAITLRITQRMKCVDMAISAAADAVKALLSGVAVASVVAGKEAFGVQSPALDIVIGGSLVLPPAGGNQLAEARSRLRLARLLLAHTQNLLAGRKQLDRALLLSSTGAGAAELRCGVLSELAHCQALLSEQRQRHTLAQAVALCRDAQGTAWGPQMRRWALHFEFRQAAAAAAAGDAAAAEAHLDVAAAAAAGQGTPDLQILALLARIQLAASTGRLTAAEASLPDAESLLASLEQALPAAAQGGGTVGRTAPAVSTARLRLHHRVLRVLVLLAAGRTGDLQAPGKGNNALLEVEELNAAAAAAAAAVNPPTPPCSRTADGPVWLSDPPVWLPAGGAAAAACLAAAGCLRPGGRLGEAAAQLAHGRQLLGESLAALCVDLEVGEQSVAAMVAPDARALLTLEALHRESAVLVHLTQADLGGAQRELVALLGLAARFPSYLAPLQALLHMLVGHYAHVAGCFSEAARHFQGAAAASGASNQTQRLAAAYAALAALAGGAPDAPAVALEALKAAGLYPVVNRALPQQERAAALLAGGRVRLAAGDALTAKLDLQRALGLAHKNLANQQLVVQALTALAPQMAAGGDAEGAHNMLMSASTLAKALRDLPSQVEETLSTIEMMAILPARLPSPLCVRQSPVGWRGRPRRAALPGHASVVCAARLKGDSDYEGVSFHQPLSVLKLFKTKEERSALAEKLRYDYSFSTKVDVDVDKMLSLVLSVAAVSVIVGKETLCSVFGSESLTVDFGIAGLLVWLYFTASNLVGNLAKRHIIKMQLEELYKLAHA